MTYRRAMSMGSMTLAALELDGVKTEAAAKSLLGNSRGARAEEERDDCQPFVLRADTGSQETDSGLDAFFSGEEASGKRVYARQDSTSEGRKRGGTGGERHAMAGTRASEVLRRGAMASEP